MVPFEAPADASRSSRLNTEEPFGLLRAVFRAAMLRAWHVPTSSAVPNRTPSLLITAFEAISGGSMTPTQPRHDDIVISRRFGEHASTHTVKQIYAVTYPGHTDRGEEHDNYDEAEEAALEL